MKEMESNRDEAIRCLNLAEKFFSEGLVEKAERFVQKSIRLFPTDKAKNLLEELESATKNGGRKGHHHSNGSAGTGQNRDEVRRRKKSTSNEESTTTTEEKDYTSEQVAAVKRIRVCQDYYEILGVSKDASEADLKKSYRKMALQFHPDKNKAPGAGEAFKAIGNSYAILSDSEKRRQYDLYGPEVASNGSASRRGRSGFYENDPTHGFEADMTAEEIFNMFFGGGFPSQNVYMRRTNVGGASSTYRRQAQFQRHFHTQQQQQQQEHSGSAALIQLLPILLILFLSLFSTLFVSDPLYNFHQSSRYPTKRITSNLKINYYVKDTFHADFQGSLRRLEATIEEDYLNNLRQGCFREKSYKENLLWQARYSGNNNLLNRAHNYATPSCDQLEKLYSY